MKTIQQGAEAVIILQDNKIHKHRTRKSYRLPVLDERLRKSRTKTEAKIIQKLSHIINGDLTTSNMILNPDNKLYFIDFGLSFHSNKIEDKAVDLHLLKQALNA